MILEGLLDVKSIVAAKVLCKKKGIFVGVAGPGQEFDTMLTTVKGFLNWANIELAETILYTNNSNELGGVRRNKDQVPRA